MKLTNRLRHRLTKAVKREPWTPAAKAQAIACIERLHSERFSGDGRGGAVTLNLDIPDYNGDAPFFDANAVVVQLLDYFGMLD